MPFKSVILRLEGERVKAMLSTNGIVAYGLNGELRLFDFQYSPCHGYQNGCVCEVCMKKSTKTSPLKTKQHIPSISTAPKRCECSKPIRNDESCLSCGKPIERKSFLAICSMIE
jgi:hypothetical protein